MNIIDLETPLNTEKHPAPTADKPYPFYITEYGKTFRNTPCYQLRVDSPIACVQFVLSGTGMIICNERAYTVRAGDTFLLPEGSNHIYYSFVDNQFERIWINFRGELARALLVVYKLENQYVFAQTDTKALLENLQTVCREAVTPHDYAHHTAPLFLQLVQFLSDNRHNEGPTPDKPTETLRRYMDTHLTENIKIADMAKTLCFSEEHIIRLFKKAYGITPHQYLLQSKIRLAMLMLRTTDQSVEQVAERLNFADARHFSTQFKRFCGYSPTHYRRLIKQAPV